MRTKIIAVGKIKEPWIRDGVKEYAKRIPKIEFLEIKDSSVEKEEEKILSNLKVRERVFVLGEEGEDFSSSEFSAILSSCDSATFIIGGPEGVSDEVKKKADVLLSLSRMTFTHEMARLFLVEQIYRSQCKNKKYHK